MQFFNSYKIRFLISIIGFVFIMVCFFLMCRYRFPVGDDVLSQFESTVSYYLDDADTSNAAEFIRITSLSQVFNNARQIYFLWTGRVFQLIMAPALGILGRNFAALFTTFIYGGGVLLGGRLICNNIKGVFDHPCMVMGLSSLMCLYNYTLGMSIMWTMSIIYGYSLFMYLLIMNITKDLIYDNKEYNIFFVNLAGFMAGISHELVGAWFILQLIFVIATKINFRNLLGITKYYIGLIIGYCICFWSPGNFNRMHQKHDAGIWRSYSDKLLGSLQVHLKILTDFEGVVGQCIFVFILISAVVAVGFIIKKGKIKSCFKTLSFFIVNIVIAVFLWAVVSYTPEYGVISALFYFILAFFVFINDFDKNKLYTGIVLIVLLCVIVDNGIFMHQFVRESLAREAKVMEAVKNNETEVHIDAYSSDLNRDFLMKDYTDNSEQYSRMYYIKYYGTKIIVDEN